MKSLILVALSMSLLAGSAVAKVHKHTHISNPPAFSSKSFLVASDDGTILREQDGDTVRPIASISKLMVAVLASEQDLNESLEIPSTRQVQSGIPKYVKTLTRYELLTMALIKSDNFAAQILCANLPNCVQSMNNKAFELGMMNTHYEEPTGLDRGNVSTAHDLLKLVMYASGNETITDISHQSSAEILLFNKKSIKIHNTNPLTAKLDIFLSKTGYTNPAGGCLVMILNTAIGHKIYILLGSRNAHTRIPDMEKLIKES